MPKNTPSADTENPLLKRLIDRINTEPPKGKVADFVPGMMIHDNSRVFGDDDYDYGWPPPTEQETPDFLIADSEGWEPADPRMSIADHFRRAQSQLFKWMFK